MTPLFSSVNGQLGLQLGIYERQLRSFTAEGDLIPLPEAAEQERQARERLEAYLRSQGIDPKECGLIKSTILINYLISQI